MLTVYTQPLTRSYQISLARLQPDKLADTINLVASARWVGPLYLPWDHDVLCVSDDNTERTTRSVNNQHHHVCINIVHHHQQQQQQQQWLPHLYTPLTNGAATFQKLGVSIFPSCPYKRLTTAVKGVHGRGVPLSSRLGGLGSVVSSPSGVWDRASAANDFVAFRVQLCDFRHLLVYLTAAWKWEIPTSPYWLDVNVMFPFNFSGVSDTPT